MEFLINDVCWERTILIKSSLIYYYKLNLSVVNGIRKTFIIIKINDWIKFYVEMELNVL